MMKFYGTRRVCPEGAIVNFNNINKGWSGLDGYAAKVGNI